MKMDWDARKCFFSQHTVGIQSYLTLIFNEKIIKYSSFKLLYYKYFDFLTLQCVFSLCLSNILQLMLHKSAGYLKCSLTRE